MSEVLEVRWPRARAWLDRIRRAAAAIEPLVREMGAMSDAYDETLPWHTTGGGSSKQVHSDPTATQAMARAQSYDEQMADMQRRLDALTATVGEGGRVIGRTGDALGEDHSLAFELYYIDCAETWSDVADEMRVSRTRLWQMRCESYAWIESHFATLVCA